MSKPISDRWIDGYADALNEFPKTATRDIAIRALRELQLYRKAIREHREKQNTVDKWNAHDRTLYRATLPEGDKP